MGSIPYSVENPRLKLCSHAETDEEALLHYKSTLYVCTPTTSLLKSYSQRRFAHLNAVCERFSKRLCRPCQMAK